MSCGDFGLQFLDFFVQNKIHRGKMLSKTLGSLNWATTVYAAVTESQSQKNIVLPLIKCTKYLFNCFIQSLIIIKWVIAIK